MGTIRFGDFEWDVTKSRVNEVKHGVSLAEALTCFLDKMAFTAPDHEHAERVVLIGRSHRDRVLFVVSVERGETIGIVSARKASPVQRKVYEHGPKG